MKRVSTNIMKRTLSWFLAIIVAIPFIGIPSTSYGATFSDIRGHWAESYINQAVSAGFVKGYPDGTFQPDSSVTRAEFTSMVNKALGNSGTTTVSFSDVPYSEWFYSDVAKGVSATFVGGYDDKTFRPNNAVTREEAAAMIARFVPTYGVSGSISSFSDKGSISSWATDAVAKISGKGYMGAYDDGKFHPSDALTRSMTAKILCDILAKENIVSSSATVKSKGTTLSGRIYSNNVTMHADLGDGDAELSNCIVLGTLYVYGGGDDTITVSNSRVANAYVERSSSSVRLLAKGQTAINKTTAGNTAILETSSLSGGLYGTGFNEVDIKGSAKTTLKGSFVKVNLTGSSADVDVESGSITTFNVNSSGKNSEITLDSKSNIGTANVNAASAFKGSGTINTMNANSSNITYETKPRYLKMGSGVSSPDKDDDGDNKNLEIDVKPKNGATKVDLDTEITLTFDKAVKKYNGSTIKDSDIEDMVTLRRGSSSGSKVSFDATINSSKKVITLTPDDDLDEDTKYYVVIPKKEFLYSNDDTNAAQTTSFKTGDESDKDITFKPKKSETGVSLSVSPTITFDYAIETYSGSKITDSYLESNIIFRVGSSSGSKVSFDAEINSAKKKITIEPKSKLKEGQKYYLAIPAKKFRTSSDQKAIEESSVTWTTTKPTEPTVSFSPANNAADVALDSKITLRFSEAVYNNSSSALTEAYVKTAVSLKNTSANNANVDYKADISSSTITLTPSKALTSGNTYNISVVGSRFKNSSGLFVAGTSSNFTAKRDIDLSALEAAIVSAQNAQKGVKISTNGTDVFEDLKWVPQNVWNDFDTALTTAIKTRDTVATTDAAKAAADTLNKATATFKGTLTSGSKFRANISALTAAISDAENAINGVVISTDGFDVSPAKEWVTQGVKDALNSAIATAKKDMDNIGTSIEVSSRTDTLNAARKAFEATIKEGLMANRTSLKSTITKANNSLDNIRIADSAADVPTGNQWVTTSERDTLNAAINSANTVYDKRQATQSEVDSAQSTLDSAIDTFKGQLKNGEKTE
ncbi:hypothetical protein Ami103574_01910 [Aminipila butyrica]|uniref:SLH domain-containing protein n=1 Tax=Aminipila butyrica TaxID=433296 RepID=A0A858BSF2_9FIRM|nr:S-layer homology domain-containing protein [Aminipila butyrica]QIB68139.1 hypothetical protein Ami103574_01910 [Aminipila butyrica]